MRLSTLLGRRLALQYDAYPKIIRMPIAVCKDHRIAFTPQCSMSEGVLPLAEAQIHICANTFGVSVQPLTSCSGTTPRRAGRLPSTC